MASSPTVARQLAQDVLVRVARDAAFAERVLHTALDRVQLPERDRAFVTELVYGTLRRQGWLDHCLTAQLRKPLDELPLPVLQALRLGAYQLLCMGVPAHSAVHESVALVRRYGRMSGLVNAVLRRLSQAPPRHDDPQSLEDLALSTHHPLWLLELIDAQRGFASTCAWAQANNSAAPLALRVNRRRIDLAGLMSALQAQGLTPELPNWGFGDSLSLRRAGAVKNLPGFAAGWFTIQDMAATMVAHLANPQPGQLVVDMCAAPGGKATHAAELMDDTGHVFALDVHATKLRLIDAHVERLGLRCVKPVALDATDAAALTACLAGHGHAPGSVDVVVVDAPCSGLGTLRRHPELRAKPRDPQSELHTLQAALLDSAARQLKPGGTLVYSVCTVTVAEGPEQVEAFLRRHPSFVIDPPVGTAWAPCTDGAYVRTWTDVHGTDSFFAARLRRKG